MANLVFIPFPEIGHLNATFKLAKSMKSRGHRVLYLGLQDFEESVRVQQLDFVCIFEDVFPKGFIDREVVKRGVETFEALVLQALQEGQAFNPLTSLGRLIRQTQPDLLIIDLLLPAFAQMAKEHGFRSVLLNTQFYNPWERSDPAYESLRDLPELVLCPEEFDFPRAEKRERCYYVEASIDCERKEIPFPWERLDRNKRIIYCSLGTQGHLIKNSRHALRSISEAISLESDWQLVLTSGEIMEPEEFNTFPPNIIAVQKAPQLDLLKRTSLMITHGGFNTVKECILFGVPMIVFPLIRDHPATAARVVHHGLGLRGNFNQISPQAVRSLIDRLDGDSSFISRVGAMGERFRELERSGRAIGIVESILSNSPNETLYAQSCIQQVNQTTCDSASLGPPIPTERKRNN
jgi:UDP:flavonoid glycosyltransferase YjiC (YdhE family)